MYVVHFELQMIEVFVICAHFVVDWVERMEGRVCRSSCYQLKMR